MLLYIVLIFVSAFLIFLVYLSHSMTKPDRNVGEWTPDELGLKCEDINFETEDDIVLRGWWIDRKSQKTVIVLHGYTASKWYEVYMKPLLKILKEFEYNILYFDFRAHGESGGERTTLGKKEYLDLEAALDWLKEENKNRCQKIGVIGYSMGAMIALKGLALDDRIDCAISDSPPIDLDATSARSLNYFAGLPSFLYHLAKPLALLIFDINTENMVDFAPKIKKPLLLVVGENDPIVEVAVIERFYGKCDEYFVEKCVTEAEHVRSLMRYPKEYKERISTFLKNNLRG